MKYNRIVGRQSLDIVVRIRTFKVYGYIAEPNGE